MMVIKNYKLTFAVIIIISFSAVVVASPLRVKDVKKPDYSIEKVRQYFSIGSLAKGNSILDSLLKENNSTSEVLYLKGEFLLLTGNNKLFEIMTRLKTSGNEKYYEILNLKLSLFLGKNDFGQLLKKAEEKYNAEPEIRYAKWLYDLDSGEFDKAAREAARVSDAIIFKYLPYLALSQLAYDRNYELAAKYLDEFNSHFKTSRYKNREMLRFLAQNNVETSTDEEIVLEYTECGAELGMIMEDENGNKIKVALDTGTGENSFTIHSLDIGKKIAGEDKITIKDGIQYNYMPKPSDIIVKAASFKSPALKNFPVKYFNGQFMADGCFSPFAFKGYSITTDPINRKVYLRKKQALETYIESLDKSRAVIVPYVVRGGWIYIPCRLNGIEYLMMIESGSRDVNINSYTAADSGIKPYDSNIEWNGKPYPVKKADFKMEIGDFSFEINAGLVSDFIVGNGNYNLAAAGDIGPDFLKKFIFTIDPFNKQVILEKLRN